jgi:hypothetical protein
MQSQVSLRTAPICLLTRSQWAALGFDGSRVKSVRYDELSTKAQGVVIVQRRDDDNTPIEL